MENNEASFHSDLLEKVEIYATRLITGFSEKLVYHNIKFAHRLVSNTEKIARHSNFNEEDLEAAIIVSWFVATGYGEQNITIVEGEFQGNLGEVATANAKSFFKKHPKHKDKETRIVDELSKAGLLSKERTSISDVIGDATLMDAVKGKNKKNIKLAYEETLLKNVSLSKKGYYETVINMLLQFKCYTEYGVEKIQPKVMKIIQDLQKEKKNIEKQEDIALEQSLGISDQELKSLKKSLKTIKGRDDRGIQTLFRTTSKNHYTLNQMVDSKASIMITVNSIILSLIIGGLAGNPPTQDSEIIEVVPIFLLSLTSILSIIFAVFAIRPTVDHGKFTEAEIRERRGNLLFFGNFYKMGIKDYEWGMLQMLNDSDYLYGTMIRDLYYLGQKLEKKYKSIRLSLNIFIVGMSLSFLIFTIHRIVHDHSFYLN